MSEVTSGSVLTPDAVWVFGYGSLIWNPGFDHAERVRARIDGHARRFWQASHDHRGTPSSPGRVATLVAVTSDSCEGMAYRIAHASAHEVLALLDLREQDGYRRVNVKTHLADGRQVESITWVAAAENPSWAGERPMVEMARQISERHGPSGSNADYLLTLAEHLDELSIDDAHVQALAGEVRRLMIA